jgi:hypothetical protein
MSEPRSPEQIEADIEQTRLEVGDTVEALAEKTNVKARVQDRIEELKGKAREKTPAGPQEGGKAVVGQIRRNPAPLVLGGAVLVAFLIGRRTARP